MPAIASYAVAANGVSRKGNALNWQAFVDRIAQEASHQHQFPWNQDIYVSNVSKLLRQLNLRDAPLGTPRQQLSSLKFPGIVDVQQTADFQISLLTFETGDRIPHHDHPDMTGVLTCASGKLTITEYDLVSAKPSEDSIIKRKKLEQLMSGDVSTLTARDRNIHAVRAHQYSQVLDIFTPPYDETRTKRTRWFEVSESSLGAESDLFYARPYRW